MSQRAQSRGGWIASFMIVGAVLVLGLLAVLYYVKTHQIEDGSQPVATENKEAGDTDKSFESDKKSQSSPEGSATDDKDSQAKTEDKKSTDESANGEAATDDTNASGSSDGSNDELPTTGPSDATAQIVGLVALAVSGAAYVQSRRGL